jgi:hypothetical protein
MRNVSAVIATVSVVLSVAACSGKGVTSESAQSQLKDAGLATSCTQQTSDVGSGSMTMNACTSPSGSKYNVLVMSQADYGEVTKIVCQGGNDALLALPVLTDKSSFIALGEVNLQFPADASAAALQKVLCGDIETFGALCA